MTHRVTGKSLRLYWNTVRGLHPEQIRHQILRRLPVARPGEPPVLPAGAIPERSGWGWRVPRCAAAADPAVLEGRFVFWGVERQLDPLHRWEAPDLGPSWNFPVHYFEAAPVLARSACERRDTALRDAVCRALDRWIDAHPAGTSIGWEPYPTALRLVNWLDVVQSLGDWSDRSWRDRVLRSLYVQAGWLDERLERHLLGTHLLKDAKALVFAGSVFANSMGERWRRRGEAIVGREIARQVHPDGGHLEPSVLYHGIALEDVLDLLNLGIQEHGLRTLLEDAARRMLDYLTGVLPPDGAWPLLGDAARDAIPAPAELLEYAGRLGIEVRRPPMGLRLFPDSGVVVYRDARQYLLADVGSIGPPHLAGHGHCDSLSFEWFVDGVPLVVDSGTRTYEPGPERRASRGTAAHNTLEIDGREQHEIWAAFRVARRSAVHATLERDAVEAELVPWHDERVRIVRRFEPGAGGIRIVDRLEGTGRHRVVSRLHLHPDCRVDRDGQVLKLRRGNTAARITIAGAAFDFESANASASTCCESFGIPRANPTVRIAFEGDLPWSCELRLDPT